MKTVVVVMISVCGGSDDYILTERRGMSELHCVGRGIDMPVVDVIGNGVIHAKIGFACCDILLCSTR